MSPSISHVRPAEVPLAPAGGYRPHSCIVKPANPVAHPQHPAATPAVFRLYPHPRRTWSVLRCDTVAPPLTAEARKRSGMAYALSSLRAKLQTDPGAVCRNKLLPIRAVQCRKHRKIEVCVHLRFSLYTAGFCEIGLAGAIRCWRSLKRAGEDRRAWLLNLPPTWPARGHQLENTMSRRARSCAFSFMDMLVDLKELSSDLSELINRLLNSAHGDGCARSPPQRATEEERALLVSKEPHCREHLIE